MLGAQAPGAAIVPSTAFPPGGAASTGFPYKSFAETVNRESDLLRLRESLTKCAEKRFQGPPAASIGENTVRGGISSDTLSPYATYVNAQAGCRNADDESAWDRSSRLFFNPTRYDRTIQVPKNLPKAISLGILSCSGNSQA
jgi:hypothetical protein